MIDFTIAPSTITIGDGRHKSMTKAGAKRRDQKKTSGGVAPVHLRKCATAKKPLNSGFESLGYGPYASNAIDYNSAINPCQS